MTNIHPDEYVAKLCENASTRKRNSLNIIHKICTEQYERGSKDFSIPTIVRLSVEAGGPSEQTIRNKSGEDYRALLNCWANYTGGVTRKPKTAKGSSFADNILAAIPDVTIRALVGTILAENSKLKGENSLLKNQINLTIDMRPAPNPALIGNKSTEMLPQPNNLLPSEITSLQHAISGEFLKEQGWTTDEQGRVKYKGRTIYKPGYVTAIKKVLANNSEDK